VNTLSVCAWLTDGHEDLFDFLECFDEHVPELAQSVQHSGELAQNICSQVHVACCLCACDWL